jgi:hypothetical protein
MKSHLLKTLTRYSATAASILAIQKMADAQIVYTDIPDTLVTDGFYYLDLNNDGTFDYRFKKGDFNTTYVSVEGLFSGNSMLGYATVSSAYIYPFKLDALDPISHNQPFSDARGILAGGTGNDANFDGAINGYLGLKFLIGGNPHFGWVRMSVSPDAQWFIIKDFAYESTAGAAILAGETGSGGGCSDNFEPNNSHQNATPVSAGVSYQALIAEGTDIDFYSIQITAGEPNLKLDLTDLPKNYNLRLLNSTGQKIAKSTNNQQADEEIIKNNLNAGTYYAVVYPKDQNKFDPNNCYTLQVETSNSPFKLTTPGEPSLINEFTVFPNPVSDLATLQFSLGEKSPVEIGLFDVQGKKIKTIAAGNFEGGNHQLKISAKGLPAGVYLLQLKTSSGMVTQKLIVR